MNDGRRDVLVWARYGRDTSLAVQMLASHGLVGVPVASVAELVARISTAGCAVLTTEVLSLEAQQEIAAALAKQPPWSDFPIILFAARGTERTSDAVEAARVLGNVTVLERPVQSRTLISAVTSALRARSRQYEARDAIQGRDQFLAMLGHELRNPLAAIVLAVEAMHALCGDVATKQRTIIDRQSRHLSRLVDDLLDVARVTSGKVVLKREPTDLARALRRCVDGAELAARNRGIEVRIDVGAEPLVVDGDLVRLEEIFTNLIGNAIKYSPDGGVIEVRARRRDGQCIIEVADSGVGIAPEMLDRIFDLFAQSVEGLARSQGGLGIGLTLVRALVELHGGTVVAESPGVGQGSCFTVMLPALPDDAVVAGERREAVPELGGALRVVLVDDNQDLVEITKDALEMLGCAVDVASDGAEGIDLILDRSPDIAFVDIGLPTVDGYGVAREVRRRAAAPLRLVAVSGYGQPEDRQRAHEAGFDEHLTKPLTTHAMKVALDTCRRAKHAADPSA